MKPTASIGIALAVLISVLRSAALADSWLGDAGHFFIHLPDVYANNPGGKAFSVTVHRHVWPADWANNGEYEIKIFAPGSNQVAAGKIAISNEHVTIDVPAGPKGVYQFDIKPGGYGLTWVQCSLDQMVIGTGDYMLTNGPFKTVDLHVMAPRRWYFYVPQGTKTFDIKHTVQPFQSHREDYGLFVMSPRGQRMTALYGGKPLEMERKTPNVAFPVERLVETDEGTAGRFWSIWATGGDSHNFSDLQIQLRGVPPWLATSPEQWFDPATGQGAPKLVYDDSPVRLFDQKNEKGEPMSRDHYFWTPATFLGDEDYNGWRGPQTILFSNPANRAIDFGVATYIADNAARFPVHFKITAPDGKVALEKDDQYGHHLSARITIPPSGAGVYRAEIAAPRWFAWQEPTTPVLLAGKPTGDGGSRFELETGIARHWFFMVPRGTKQFRVGTRVVSPDHVLLVEVHGPDRMLDLLYVRGGPRKEVTVDVPPSLDGRIWFLRTEVGSATRFVSDDKAPRHVNIEADIDLYGVPGYLAPTWEQWFDPTAGK